MSAPVPHFELTTDLIKAVNRKEVMATVDALEEAGLLRAPYCEYTIAFRPWDFYEFGGWSHGGSKPGDSLLFGVKLTIHAKDATNFRATKYSAQFLIETSKGWSVDNIYNFNHAQQMEFHKIMGASTCLLVTALATKNTVVRTSYNKRAARGHGNGHFRAANGVIRLSRTVVDAPPCVVNSTGRRMPRHLRRGHIHRFWKGGALVPKFIPPVWVNDAVGTPAKKPVYSVAA